MLRMELVAGKLHYLSMSDVYAMYQEAVYDAA